MCWKVACLTLENLRVPSFIIYLFIYFSEVLGALRAKLILKRYALLGWELCDVLQCNLLHKIFLEVGGLPSVNLAHSGINIS